MFDLDLAAGFAGHVDGGSGAEYVEGNVVVMCQYRHAAGADLVGNIAIGGYPVAAHHTGLYPPVFHNHAGHVIADQGDINSGAA